MALRIFGRASRQFCGVSGCFSCMGVLFVREVLRCWGQASVGWGVFLWSVDGRYVWRVLVDEVWRGRGLIEELYGGSVESGDCYSCRCHVE